MVAAAEQQTTKAVLNQGGSNDRNKVNRESLANALCNDNNIVKLEDLQKHRKPKP